MALSTHLATIHLEGREGHKATTAELESFKVNCAAREGPPEEPLGMSHSSPSALGHVAKNRGCALLCLAN